MNRQPDLPPPGASEAGVSGRFHLRILATSDIHGAVLPYDYAAARDGACFGLACTASLIATARQEATGACLLVDNGDFLQGTPLSDLPEGLLADGTHPVIAVMNHLGYDAANLGNHEFNFGLPALRSTLDRATFPVICANALVRRGATVAEDETLVPPARIVERDLPDATGARHRLRIGLLGLLPPQITAWDRFQIGGDITARGMAETAAARVPLLREAGADLVVLLAHTGIDDGTPGPQAENAALTLAGLPGIDAIVAGHSHEVFPDHEGIGTGYSPETFSGVPAVMPGFRGSHLGIIDLSLDRVPGGGWHVSGHRAQTRPVKPEHEHAPAPADPAIVAMVRQSHEALLESLQAPIGQTAVPVHTYLSHVRSDLPVRLVAEAQRVAVARALAGGPLAELPVLSATAPFHTGGRAGPDAYTDIPAGPLTLRSATDLQPFPNTLCALCMTGAELRDWLERAVSCFHRVLPGRGDQPLWNARFPGHAADTVAGVSYRIDLTQPPLYDHQGTALAAEDASGPGRIRELSHDGAPVDPDGRFVMAVNNYRASGGGPYPAFPESRLVHSCDTPVREVVAAFIRAGGPEWIGPEPVWSFLPVPDASALIETGPGLLRYPEELTSLGLTRLGMTGEGFLRLRMPLDTMACESAL